LKFSPDYGNIDIKIECGSNITSPTSDNRLDVNLNDIIIIPKLVSIISAMNKDLIKSTLTSAGRSIKQFSRTSTSLNSISRDEERKESKSRDNLPAIKKMIFIKVSITDDGPGISPENQSKLFNNFVQIRPTQLQEGQGSGFLIYMYIYTIYVHLIRIFYNTNL
jgi:signal transduction histidine kinase